VSIRLLDLIFVRLCGWLVLLGRPSACKDANCWCCGTRSLCCAAPIPGPGWTGQTARSSPHSSGSSACRGPASGPVPRHASGARSSRRPAA